jgi:hypothetical protein
MISAKNKKRCSVRLCLQLFVVGCMSCLRNMRLIAHNNVQHILCCVFVSFGFFLCTQCCLFLWIFLFLLPLRYSLTFICPVSCVPYVASFSGLSIFLPLRYSLTFICPVSCVPYVASFSGLSFCIAPSVFSNIYLSCVMSTLSCQFLWIVLFHYPFGIV